MTAAATEPDRDVEREQFPGDPDMWLFVVFESLVFTSYFCIYLYQRTHDQQAFLDEQSALNIGLGVLDTIALLTSSWAVARCVRHTRAGRYDAARRAGAATAGLGVVFLALEVAEWVHRIRGGHTFTSSDFMQHFFFLTSLHAVHLVIGYVALGILLQQLGPRGRRNRRTVETCATYWHTVDLFWVVIFSLLFVVR